MSEQVVISQTISLAAIALAVISLLINEWRKTKIDAKQLEKRLTDIENHLFTDKDSDCLKDVALKIGLLWKVVEVEFPKILRNKNTPELDILLNKVIDSGLSSLTAEEFTKLKNGLSDEYAKALLLEDENRAIPIALWQAILEYQEMGAPNNGSSSCFLQ
jgi:hypothetical protein